MDLITLALSKNYTNKAVQEAQLAPTAFKVVDTLPSVGETGFIYLVPKEDGKDKNIYTEYIWAENAFEKIGDTEINLQDYATKEYVDNNKEVVTFKMNNSEVTSPTVFQPVIDAIFAGKMVEIEVNVGVKNIYRLANVDENSGLITFYELGFGSSNEGGFHRTKCLYITARIDTTTRQVITVSQYERFFDYISPTNRYDTPYIPQYEGSPATKKYVDTAIEAAITGAIEGAY